MTEAVAREILQSIFARWSRLEETKAAISEDLKELFAEAKGNDFDPKALRIAFRAKVKADEPESDADRATKALVEGYLDMLDAPARVIHRPRARPAPARVEIIEEIPTPIETEVQRGQADKPTAPAPMGSEPKASEEETLASVSGAVQGRCEPTAPTLPDEDVPSFLRRGHPDNKWAVDPAHAVPSHIREAGART